MDERNEMILLIFWIRGGVGSWQVIICYEVLGLLSFHHTNPDLRSRCTFHFVLTCLGPAFHVGLIYGCFALQFTHVLYLTSASLLILNTNLFSTTSKLYLTGMTTMPKTLPVTPFHNLIASPESIFSSLTS